MGTVADEIEAWRGAAEEAVRQFREIEPLVMDVWSKAGEEAPGILRRVLNYLPFTSGQSIWPKTIDPLLNTLVGGMAGAGIGYGLGVLGEKFLPESWSRHRLRNSLMLLGGGMGASPGLGMLASNWHAGVPLSSTDAFQSGFNPEEARRLKQQSDQQAYRDAWETFGRMGGKQASDDGEYLSTGLTSGLGFDPQEFQRSIWQDPRVAGPLTLPQQAAASGLVLGAANLPGRRRSGLVTPVDMARMAAGMGSGYLSGLLVGKTLGALMGLPDSAQETLKNTGMWAGVVREIVPLVFGQ
jgi:hypothetical protein